MTHGSILEEPNHNVELFPKSSMDQKTEPMSSFSSRNNNTTLIELDKEEDYGKNLSGLGFNVVGGSDSEHIPGEPGIFISLINEYGAAARDGRLQPGDKILAVNGVDLTNRTHDEAVNILRKIEKHASLLVQNAAERTIVTEVVPLPVFPQSPSPSLASNSNLTVVEEVKTVTIKPIPEIINNGIRREEDEESFYAPSTHSFIDDVPRTPKRPQTLYERASPIMVEALYATIGVVAISAGAYILYKLVLKRRR